MHLVLRELEPLKVWLNYIGPLEKLDFSMPYCSILFTDSEYITLFKMPCILRELEPLKVCIFGQAIEIEKWAS